MADTDCPLCGGDARLGEPRVDDRKPIKHIVCARCGEYFIEHEAEGEVRSRDRSAVSAMLSGVTREHSERGSPITLCYSGYAPSEAVPGVRVAEVIDTLVPRSIPDRIDRALQNLARRSRYPGDAVAVDADKDWPLFFAENRQSLGFALSHMIRSGLLDEMTSYDQGGGSYALTVEGWDRVEELSRLRPQSRQAFVAMWFDPQLNEAWKDGLEPAIRGAGYDPIRVDKEPFNERIDDWIIAGIRRSRFLVADVTQHRQAVYFEAGFAMGLGLPVIFTCHKDHLDKCNFDTRQYNHIVWESPDDLREKLKNRIEATIV